MIEFISDLHLGPDTPQTFSAWRDYLRSTEADMVFMLGDLFEVWVGDDAIDEPGSFEAECAAVLAEATRQRPIAFMAGNRDFLIGEAFSRCTGVQLLADPMLLEAFGRRVLVVHGDQLCLDDIPYQAFRQQVRNPAWQQGFLALPLARRREMARAMRDTSEKTKRAQSPGDWADVDAACAVEWLQAAGSAELLHGHTHRPATEALAPGFIRHVLSDWDLEAPTPRAEVMRLTRDGFSRHRP